MTIDNLLRFTKNGITVAEYYEIRDVLVQLFKDIYGSDIDLSTNNADGTYIESLSLIINNILQGVKILYKNLNIDSASGSYLENLCALSGIYRKQATNAKAWVSVKNNGSSTITVNSVNPTFKDKDGLLWHYDGALTTPVLDSISIAAGVTVTVPLVCDTSGEVNITSDWIDGVTDASYNVEVTQTSYAKGTNKETDADLRSRRSEIINGSGVSVVEGLKSALLNIGSVEEVTVYNNNSATSITSKDGTTVNSHDQYIIIKNTYGVTLDDQLIARIIYNKLTPGVITTQSGISGDRKSGTITLPFGGYTTTVNWKQPSPIMTADAPNISVTLSKQSTYATTTDAVIKEGLRDYLNGLSMEDSFTSLDLVDVINSFDPLYYGRRTYECTGVSIDAITDKLTKVTNTMYGHTYTLKDNYFNVVSSDITLS